MNVLLLYPRIPDTFWSFRHSLKFINKKSNFPPLGLLTISAMVPSSWNKRLLDLNFADFTQADLAWADYVFISAMTVQSESAIQILSQCKQMGVPVVAGGPFFTARHREFDTVDHFVLNEAELTLPPFLADLNAGRAKRIYRTDQFCDLAQSPIPMWHLADFSRYARMCIQFSRGCPFNCDFCDVTVLFGNRQRFKSDRQIIAELDALYNCGWRGGIFFSDDNFIANKPYLKSHLLPELIRWRKGKNETAFYTQVTINLADDENLMEMMIAAGFEEVFIGLETPNDCSLHECGKETNRNRDLIENVNKIHGHGLQVQGGFIIGFDSDTPSIFQRQIDLIQQSGIVIAMVGLLQAFEGTELHRRMKMEGRLIGPESGDNVDGGTNIRPKMGMESLRQGYRYLMHTIYAPEYFYRRVQTFLEAHRSLDRGMTVNAQRLLALFLAIIRLGILGKERFQFWNLFLWALRHRPKLFGLAIACSIYGYHMRRICESKFPK